MFPLLLVLGAFLVFYTLVLVFVIWALSRARHDTRPRSRRDDYDNSDIWPVLTFAEPAKKGFSPANQAHRIH